MNLLKNLTIKNLKLNKKRTIVTIMGIILSIALLSAVASMFFSCRASLIDFEKERSGNFHYAFYPVKQEDISKFRLNKKIETFYTTSDIGYAKLDGIINKNKPYIFVKAFSSSALENLGLKVIKGRLPQNSEEVVIPSHLDTNGGVELNVGDTITLDVGTRVRDDTVLSQDNPYDTETTEKIVNPTSMKYKIVGIIERPTRIIEPYTAPGYTFITYEGINNKNDNETVYVRYTKEGMKDYYTLTANILGVDAKIYKAYFNPSQNEIKNLPDKFDAMMKKANYQAIDNSYLLTLETLITGDSMLNALATAATIVIVIIIFTSVFCIHNSFNISLTERIKEYGMLRSVGATKKQIKASIYYEAFILGIIGIPLGILAGHLASYILILISNYLLSSSFEAELDLHFAFSYLAIFISIILGSVTIFLSSLSSAWKAKKITPIRAIRNSANLKIEKKKIKAPKIISKLFGVGGEISYKNLKRSRKKYRTTVISIVVCSAVFIALSTFVNMAFDVVKLEYGVQSHNITGHLQVDTWEELNSKVEEIKKLPEIKELAFTENAYADILYPDKYYSKKYPQNGSDRGKIYSEDKDKEIPYDNITSILVDDDYFKDYCQKLKIDYDEVKTKFIYIPTFYGSTTDDLNTYYEMEKFNFKEGDILKTGFANQENYTIEIAKITSIKPSVVEEKNYDVILIGNMNYQNPGYEKRYINIHIDSKNANKTQKDLQEILKGYDVSIINNEESRRQMQSLFILVAIFLYGFITVIALIGLTNIFNTITTNMNLRRQEFAILKSIGMTKKEFNRMIRLESVFYGVKALIIGIPLGLLLSYLIYHALMDGELVLLYKFPTTAVILTCLIVFILIFVIMKYSLKKIDKENMIETIRNENI